MSKKRYVVDLTQEERAILRGVVDSNGRVGRQKRIRAQVLLKIDQGQHGCGWTDQKAAEAFDVSIRAVEKLRKRLVEEGFEEVLQGKKPAEPARKPIFDAKGEGEVLAVATGKPPDGRARWTLRLLAGEVVRLQIAESVSHETIRKVLKKGIFNPTDRWDG
jgi:transposase